MHKLKIAILMGVIILVIVTLVYKLQSTKFKARIEAQEKLVVTNDSGQPTTKIRAECPSDTKLYVGTFFGSYPYSFCFKPKFFSIEPSDFGFVYYKLDSSGVRIDADRLDDKETSSLGGVIYYRNIPNAEYYFTMGKDPEWKFIPGKARENENDVRIVEFDINLYGKDIQGFVIEDKDNEAVLYIDHALPLDNDKKSFIKLLADTIQF